MAFLDIDATQWGLLLLGAAAGGFVNGLAGFGTALFALGFWLAVMPPASAVALAALFSVVAGVQGVWIVRREVRFQLRRLARFALPGLLGVPVGLVILARADVDMLRAGVAVALLAYGALNLLRRGLPVMSGKHPIPDMGVGFLGGVMGGAASLSGVVPTMWCALQPWPKSETRAVLQPFNRGLSSNGAENLHKPPITHRRCRSRRDRATA